MKVRKYNSSAKDKLQRSSRSLLVSCICLIALLNSSSTSFAQTASDGSFGIDGEKVVVFGEDKVSIWGNFRNADTTSIEAQGKIIFYGNTWTNFTSGTMELSGALCMKNPRPAPYAATFAQELNNNGTDNEYSTLEIDNPLNVTLNDPTIITDTLRFISGKIILDNNNLTVKNTATDAIQGYTEDKYIVTGTGATGGFLTREGVATATIDFPIGTSTTSYTPAALANTGTADNFSVRVFNGVYEDGTSGISQVDNSVGRTWDIQEETAGGSDVTLSLQHNGADEGANFSRAKCFVTHYIGVAPNTAGDTSSLTKWDLIFDANMGVASATGTITSGSAIAGAHVTSRSGFTSFSPFSVAGAGNAPLPVDLITFDVDKVKDQAHIFWQTATEVNNDYFQVFRRLEGEEEFSLIHQEVGAGNSNQILNYEHFDDISKIASGKVFYRLKQVDFDGTSEWSDLRYIFVDPSDNNADIAAYPNPASNSLNIFIKGYDGEFEYNFVNALGQQILDGTASKREVLDVSTLQNGVYYLHAKFEDSEKHISVTKDIRILISN